MFFIAAALAATAIAGVSAQDAAVNAAPTPAPGYDYAYTQEMPYTWMTSEGYKSVDCGYGYNKDDSQHCKKADWVRRILPVLPSPAHYLHLAFLWNSIITRAATQQQLSSKFPLRPCPTPVPCPPSPSPRARVRHSHCWLFDHNHSSLRGNTTVPCKYAPIREEASSHRAAQSRRAVHRNVAE
jgi:hypothetical protein